MRRRKPTVPVHLEGLIRPGPARDQAIGTYPGIGVMTDLVEAVIDVAGDEILTPLPNSMATLNLGTRHAPEGACLPFKLIMGSLLQSLARGANTPGMITEQGPCRLGLYSLGMRLIFSDLGLGNSWFDFSNSSIREGYVARYRRLFREKYGRRLSWTTIGRAFLTGIARLAAVEALEAERNRLLAYEVEPGSIEKVFAEGRSCIRSQPALLQIWRQFLRFRGRLRAVPVDRSRETVRVVITGEVYCVIDPFTNCNIEARLARMGAEPFRVLWQTDYILGGMRMGALRKTSRAAAFRASRAYLPEHIGGDCAPNVGYAVLAHRRGEDGLVHIKPFACMLEVVTENLLQAVERDTGFPILSLTLDDLSAEDRLTVRLEAFVENLFRRRRARETGRAREM